METRTVRTLCAKLEIPTLWERACRRAYGWLGHLAQVALWRAGWPTSRDGEAPSAGALCSLWVCPPMMPGMSCPLETRVAGNGRDSDMQTRRESVRGQMQTSRWRSIWGDVTSQVASGGVVSEGTRFPEPFLVPSCYLGSAGNRGCRRVGFDTCGLGRAHACASDWGMGSRRRAPRPGADSVLWFAGEETRRQWICESRDGRGRQDWMRAGGGRGLSGGRGGGADEIRVGRVGAKMLESDLVDADVSEECGASQLQSS